MQELQRKNSEPFHVLLITLASIAYCMPGKVDTNQTPSCAQGERARRARNVEIEAEREGGGRRRAADLTTHPLIKRD